MFIFNRWWWWWCWWWCLWWWWRWRRRRWWWWWGRETRVFFNPKNLRFSFYSFLFADKISRDYAESCSWAGSHLRLFLISMRSLTHSLTSGVLGAQNYSATRFLNLWFNFLFELLNNFQPCRMRWRFFSSLSKWGISSSSSSPSSSPSHAR